MLSVLDLVRVYEDFATLDLISDGRVEIGAGRASRIGAPFDKLMKNFEMIEKKWDNR